MKVFIFGAGASFGSQGFPSPELTPPLVNEIFDEKYREYGNIAGLTKRDLEELKNSIKKDQSLEDFLTDYYQKKLVEQKNQGAQKKLGQIAFYIWWMLQKVSAEYNKNDNLYYRLIEKLGVGNCGLISFNYDTLLDRALIDNGAILLDKTSSSLEEYTKNKYIKPHGSVNFFLKKRESDPEVPDREEGFVNIMYSMATTHMLKDEPIGLDKLILYNPDIPLLLNPDTTMREIGSGNTRENGMVYTGKTNYGYPLIFLPLSAKLYGWIKGFKDRTMEDCNKLLAEADDIYIIGYSVNDDIIKDLLKNMNNNAKINVVLEDDDKGKAARIRDSLISLNPKLQEGIASNDGFKDFVDNKL